MTTTTTGPDRTAGPDRTNHHAATVAGQPQTAPRTPDRTSDRRKPHLWRRRRSAAPLTPEQAKAAAIMHIPDRVLALFYISVLGIALYGQVDGLHHKHQWIWITAVYAGITIELFGVALSFYADARRQLGERALVARALAAGAAGLACWINWTGHDHTGAHAVDAWFYTSMSVVAFAAFLLRSGAARRDALRHERKMGSEPPVYELWADWIRHPAVTARARGLAKVDSTLGLEGSRRAARDAIRTEKRDAALAEVLRARIAAKVGPELAEIAARTYDLSEIAARLRARADYDALSELIGRDLTPDRLAGPDLDPGRTGRRGARRSAAPSIGPDRAPGPDRTGPESLAHRSAPADRTPDRTADPDRTSVDDELDRLSRTVDEAVERTVGPDRAGEVPSLDAERDKIRETLQLILNRYGDLYPSWAALLAAVSGERMRADLKIGKPKINAARQHTDLLPWPSEPLVAGGDG